jgi:predicted phage terminase large subunit-like protein
VTVTKRLQQLEESVARLAEDREPSRHPISLRQFVGEAWPILEPGTGYLHNWHLDVLSEYLEAVFAGQIKRLLINVPPRTGKSLWCGILWPAWCWTRRPEMRFMFTSYSTDLSIEHSVKRRLVIESPWYQEHWGKLVQLSDDQNAKSWFTNTRQGQMLATSMSGTATGKGADILVVDDAHNAKQAESEVERATTVQDFRLTFSTRLNDKKTGAIAIIAQRLHVADLYGYALEWGYDHLFLPAEATKKSTLVLPSGRVTERDNIVRTPSGKEIVREPGSLLWPDREGPAEIESARKSLGSNYSGQYQQQPSPEGGTKFQRSWFRYFDELGLYWILHRPSGDEKFERSRCTIFQTCDLALTTKEKNDYSVIATWAFTPSNDLLLLHINRFRKESPEVKTELEQAVALWRPQFQAIEKAHYGMAVCQEFQRRGWPLRELIADKEKVVRSATVQIQMENGKVFFRQDAAWLIDFEAELLLFPNGVHDDQVDTMSYAGILLGERVGYSLPEGYKGIDTAGRYASPTTQFFNGERRGCDLMRVGQRSKFGSAF